MARVAFVLSFMLSPSLFLDICFPQSENAPRPHSAVYPVCSLVLQHASSHRQIRSRMAHRATLICTSRRSLPRSKQPHPTAAMRALPPCSPSTVCNGVRPRPAIRERPDRPGRAPGVPGHLEWLAGPPAQWARVCAVRRPAGWTAPAAPAAAFRAAGPPLGGALDATTAVTRGATAAQA